MIICYLFKPLTFNYSEFAIIKSDCIQDSPISRYSIVLRLRSQSKTSSAYFLFFVSFSTFFVIFQFWTTFRIWCRIVNGLPSAGNGWRKQMVIDIYLCSRMCSLSFVITGVLAKRIASFRYFEEL